MGRFSDINDIVDGTMSPPDEEEINREKEIQKQKEKRKRKKIEEKESIKREKADKKKEERKKNIEKKKKKQKQKEIEKKKADSKKAYEKQQKQKEKEKNEIKKELEKQRKLEEKHINEVKKEKAKKKKQEEKQKKLEEQRKREEREKRIQQRKANKQEDDFDYEANSAIKMTMKNNQRKKQQEEYSKKQKELAKRRKRVRRIVTSILIILIFSGTTAFALISPIFNIKEVQVVGNEQLTSEKIKSISELHENENIFKFLKINVINKIKQEPYVESVEIKRVLPSEVLIKVNERKKKFNIHFLNSYAIINSQGYILELSEEKQPLPTIEGIATPEENIEAGKRLEDKDLNILEVVIKIMDIFKANDMDEQVEVINVSDELEINITMQDEKIIHLGNKTDLNNKIVYAQAIMKENKGVPGEIFVNGDFNNKFKPYFREKIQ